MAEYSVVLAVITVASVAVFPAFGAAALNVVVKVTGIPVSALAFTSATDAVIVDMPPSDDTVVGFALTTTRPTAAAPIAILTAPFAPTDAPPETVSVYVPGSKSSKGCGGR